MKYSRGSSRIKTLMITVTGGIGPTGAAGPTGNTGSYVIGMTGNAGLGITGFTYDSSSYGLTFYIQGSTAAYLTGFKGNTGDGQTLSPPNIISVGNGISFIGSSGYTLFFRSITFSAGISAYISGDSIVIRENPGDTGSFDPNQLLFVDFAGITYFLDSSPYVKYNQNVYSGKTYGNLEVTRRTNRDLFGVENFNYSTGSAQNSSHYGLTMTIDSAFYGMTGTEIDLKIGAWNPYLKYRAEYYDLYGLSGSTFNAVSFSPLGPYQKQISFTVETGSCCYCEDCISNAFDGRLCLDYVTKSYCNQINGRWSKSTCYQRQNTYDCFLRRACCVNGTCINTSKQKCDQMGGVFCSRKECGLDYTCGDVCIPSAAGGFEEGGQICCCCENGVATQDECGYIEAICKGTVYDQDCSGVNCCDQIVGACCKNGACLPKSIVECRAEGGLFYGQGVSCNDVSCCDSI